MSDSDYRSDYMIHAPPISLTSAHRSAPDHGPHAAPAILCMCFVSYLSSLRSHSLIFRPASLQYTGRLRYLQSVLVERPRPLDIPFGSVKPLHWLRIPERVEYTFA
jgi:hypothetical protein